MNNRKGGAAIHARFRARILDLIQDSVTLSERERDLYQGYIQWNVLKPGQTKELFVANNLIMAGLPGFGEDKAEANRPSLSVITGGSPLKARPRAPRANPPAA